MNRGSDRYGAEWAASALLLIIGLLLLRAMWPVSVDAVLELKLFKNALPISQLDQPRQVIETRSQWIDRLDLSREGRFAHPKLGVLGWGEHYFVDLQTRIEVPATTSFRFEISSDDGFALHLDERRICAHTGDRAMATQTCTALLLAGEHRLQVYYFQGGGPAGLAVRYAAGEQSGWRWLGEDSDSLRFLKD